MRAVPRSLFAHFAAVFLLAACGGQQAQADSADVPASAADAEAAPAAVAPADAANAAASSAPPADADAGGNAASGPAAGEELLRPSFGACMRGAGGATPAMQDCIAEEYTHQDGRLNTAYRTLRGRLPQAESRALLAAQRAWIKRRDAECAWDATTEGQAQRLVANDCMLRMTAIRAAELEAATADGAASTALPAADIEVSADGALGADGRLRLALSGVDVDIDAAGCREHSASVQHCTGGVRLTVSADGQPRELRADALYLNDRATAYRGPLDDPADRAGRSIVIADMDRDGREDIALWTGTRGANGAASYDVYLAGADGYRLDAALSALTQGANGLFTLDDGQLVRMSKSGCCIHATARYAWRDGKPVLVEEVVEDATADRASPTVTTRRRIDGRMQTVVP